jgi:NADPH:quinone reductase-like Zn-dependent oxidoreductase
MTDGTQGATTRYRDLGAEFGVGVTRATISDSVPALRAVVDLAERGIWRPQVAAVMPLAAAAQAPLAQERGQVTRGRIVLEIGDETAA